MNKEKTVFLIAVLLVVAAVTDLVRREIVSCREEPRGTPARRSRTRRPDQAAAGDGLDVRRLASIAYYLEAERNNPFLEGKVYQDVRQVLLDRLPLPPLPIVQPALQLVPFVDVPPSSSMLAEGNHAASSDEDWIRLKDGTLLRGRIDIMTRTEVSIFLPQEKTMRHFPLDHISETHKARDPYETFRDMEKKLDRRSVDAWLNLARWAWAHNLKIEARNTMASALKEHPAAVEAYLLSGAMEASDPRRVLEIYETGIRRVREPEPLILRAMPLYADLGLLEEGRRRLQSSVGASSVKLNQYLGVMAWMCDDHQQAMDILQPLAGEYPRDLGIQNAFALTLYSTGQYAQAVQALESVLRQAGQKQDSVLNNYAVMLFRAGKRSEAVKILRMLRDRNPTSKILDYNLGCFALAEASLSRAAAHFRMALGEQDNPWALAGLAAVKLQQGMRREAAEEFERASRKGLNKPWMHYLQGLACLETDPVRARGAFEAAGRFTPALAGLAWIAGATKDPAARQYLESALQYMPDNDIRIRLGIVMQDDDPDRARELFHKVLDQDADNLYARNGLARIRYHEGGKEDALRDFASIVAWEKDWKKSSKFFEIMNGMESRPLGFEPSFTPQEKFGGDFQSLLDDWKKGEPISPARVEAFSMLANDLFLDGDPDTARSIYDEVLKRDKDFYLAHLGLGYMALKDGHVDQAMDRFLRAKNRKPKNDRIRNELGVCYFLRGEKHDFERAKDEFRRALSTNSNHPTAFSNLALAYWKLNQIDKGIEKLTALAEMETGNPDPLLALGRLYLIQRDHEQAIRLFERAGELSQGDAKIHLSLVDAYIAAGRLDDAELELERVLRTNPEGWESTARQAVLLAAQGRYREALHKIDQAIGQSSGSAELHYRKAMIALRLGAVEDAQKAFEDLHALTGNDGLEEQGKACIAMIRESGRSFAALVRRTLYFQPVEGWAQDAIDRITGSRAKRFWEDDFDREDGEKLMREWVEYEGFGVEITIADHAVLFAGAQDREDWGETRFSREVARDTFLEYAMDMIDAGERAVSSGIFLSAGPDSILFGRSPAGAIAYTTSHTGNPGEWTYLADWPATGEMRLAIRQKAENRGTFELLVDNRTVATDVGLDAVKRESLLRIGGYAKAPRNTDCRVWFDNAYLEEYK